jgi:hypothetical protein
MPWRGSDLLCLPDELLAAISIGFAGIVGIKSKGTNLKIDGDGRQAYQRESHLSGDEERPLSCCCQPLWERELFSVPASRGFFLVRWRSRRLDACTFGHIVLLAVAVYLKRTQEMHKIPGVIGLDDIGE